MTETRTRTLEVGTRDGVCPVYMHLPAGDGPWPAAILYMDGPGIRPAMHEIAARLAGAGYAVALPDLFYRAGPYAPVDPKVVWSDPDLKAAHRATYMESAKPQGVMADTRAIIEALDALPDIVSDKVGVVGYCMGGRLALIAAGTFPDRVAVAASYHGGGLANVAPSSPHLLASDARENLCRRCDRGCQFHRRDEGAARTIADVCRGRPQDRNLSRQTRLGTARHAGTPSGGGRASLADPDPIVRRRAQSGALT